VWKASVIDEIIEAGIWAPHSEELVASNKDIENAFMPFGHRRRGIITKRCCYVMPIALVWSDQRSIDCRGEQIPPTWRRLFPPMLRNCGISQSLYEGREFSCCTRALVVLLMGYILRTQFDTAMSEIAPSRVPVRSAQEPA